MTSGWPTTTVYNPEIAATCILDASAARSLAQYAYWYRDGGGGIYGVLIRVNAASPITVTEYGISPDGELARSDSDCSLLSSGGFEPPFCSE